MQNVREPVYDISDTRKYPPADLTQYILTTYSIEPPPYHVTANEVTKQRARLSVSHISAHQNTPGRRGKIAVKFEASLQGLRRAFWGRIRRSVPPPYYTHIRMQPQQQHPASNKKQRNMFRGAAAV